MNVQVEVVTDISVRVSWERIFYIPEITHYTVFYNSRARSKKRQADNEQSISVSFVEDSVVIENLCDGARPYQFVVVAVATVNNVEIEGERSTNPITLTPPTSDGGMYELVMYLLFHTC